MPQNTANADAVLKDHYIGPVREQLNQKSVLMFAADDDGAPDSSTGETQGFRGIARESESIEFAGRKWIVPSHISRNEGLGAIAEGGILPIAGQQGWEDLQDTVKHNVGVIKITRYAIKLSNRNAAAFLRLLEGETKGMVNDIRKDVGRQAYGNQTGTLAAVTADGASACTVDTVQYLRVGMFIDLIDVTNDTALVTNRQITNINETTKIVTYSGADAAATTNHRLCRTGSWKKEINGLGVLINNTGNVHGVDSTLAVNNWHRSTVADGGGQTFSEDQGQQVIDSVGRGGNAEVELLVTTRGVVRRYSATLKSEKRFNDANSLKLRGGFTYLDFNGMPMVYDDDCPKGTMWFLNTDALLWAYLPNGDSPGYWDWVDDDGAILSRATDRSDAFEGYLAADHDLGVTARNQLGRINNLADDAAQIWN